MSHSCRSCVNFCSVLLLGALLGCGGMPPEPVDGVKTTEVVPVAAVPGQTATGSMEADALAFQRALALMRAQRYAQALVIWQSLADSSGDSVLALLNLGITYSRLGALAEAGTSFHLVLERDPANAIAYNELGIVERRQGRFEQAGISYRRALELRPDYAPAHLNLGILCDLYLQNADCAMRHYQAYRKFAGSGGAPVGLWIKDLAWRYPERQVESTGE